jgi:hypothetical protein
LSVSAMKSEMRSDRSSAGHSSKMTLTTSSFFCFAYMLIRLGLAREVEVVVLLMKVFLKIEK